MRPASALSDLGEVERAGARVEQADSEQDQVGAEGVGDREVERLLQRLELLDIEARERVGGDAHQLEPDEHVEEVAGECKASHGAAEHEHQDVEESRRIAHVGPRVDQCKRDQPACECRHAGPERIGRECDPDRDPAVGAPPAEPLERLVPLRGDHDHERDRGRRGRPGGGERMREPARGDVAGGSDGGRRQQRDHDRKRQQSAHG